MPEFLDLKNWLQYKRDSRFWNRHTRHSPQFRDMRYRMPEIPSFELGHTDESRLKPELYVTSNRRTAFHSSSLLNSGCWKLQHDLTSPGYKFQIPKLRDIRRFRALLTAEINIQNVRIDIFWLSRWRNFNFFFFLLVLWIITGVPEWSCNADDQQNAFKARTTNVI